MSVYVLTLRGNNNVGYSFLLPTFGSDGAFFIFIKLNSYGNQDTFVKLNAYGAPCIFIKIEFLWKPGHIIISNPIGIKCW